MKQKMPPPPTNGCLPGSNCLIILFVFPPQHTAAAELADYMRRFGTDGTIDVDGVLAVIQREQNKFPPVVGRQMSLIGF